MHQEQQKGALMFGFVGWLFVTSFALYGLITFINDHVVVGKRQAT
jgi:hypothetical protein